LYRDSVGAPHLGIFFKQIWIPFFGKKLLCTLRGNSYPPFVLSVLVNLITLLGQWRKVFEISATMDFSASVGDQFAGDEDQIEDYLSQTFSRTFRFNR